MINFDTWLKMVEDVYGAKIVDWMLPFAENLFDDNFSIEEAAIELHEIWWEHNHD